MGKEIAGGGLNRKRSRLSLATPQNARKALAKILRDYALASPEEREAAEYVRVLIHGLSELLADFRKQQELDLTSKIAGLEEAVKGLEAHRGIRAVQ